jgi:hypothetical protein
MFKDIQNELANLTAESSRGPDHLYNAMTELARLEHELDTTEQKAFLDASGTVADRQAIAKLAAAQARFERDIAKAKLERIKLKVRVLDTNIGALQTQARLVQAETRL